MNPLFLGLILIDKFNLWALPITAFLLTPPINSAICEAVFPLPHSFFNISSIFGDSKVSNNSYKGLTSGAVNKVISNLEEVKKSAKDPKILDVDWDITDEIADILGIKLVKRGLLDKMQRPDYMSASTSRMTPSASVSGNLQTGRQGIVPGRDYLFYDNTDK